MGAKETGFGKKGWNTEEESKMGAKETGFGKKGWMLIIYCLITFYVATAFKDTMNIAVMTFEEQYGWDRTLLLSLASIGAYVTCIAIYLLGIITASGKVKLRSIILVTGLMYAITISLWGVIPNLNVFIANYIIMTIGFTVWSQFANNALCGKWFPKKSGHVLGWTTIGFPLAAATNALLFNTLLKYMEFKNIYFLFGFITLLVCLWGYFGFRDDPEEMGFFPDNDTSMDKEKLGQYLKKERELERQSIWSTKRMLKIKETWLISISNGVLLLVASGSMGQMVVRFLSGGLEIGQAVKLMTIVGISSAIGSWAFGKFDYRYGVKNALLLAIAVTVASCGLYSINQYATMAIGASGIGVGLGASSNLVVSCTNFYWKRRNFKKAYGTILTLVTIIGSAGAIVVANLAKVTNYSVAYWIIAALVSIGFFTMLPVKEGFVEKYEEEYKRELAS